MITGGRLESVLVRTLSPYPGNPRRGDVAAIAQSLEANGQFAPIVVRGSDLVVLSGNHTLEAAVSLGWDELDCWLVDADEELSRRIVLAANRTAALGTYDQAALAELLASIEDGDLYGTGYDQDAFDDLMASLEEESAPAAGGGRRGRMPNNSTAGQRMLVLDFTIDGFLWVQDGLREVCEAHGVDSNVAAVVKLLQSELGPDIAELPEGIL